MYVCTYVGAGVNLFAVVSTCRRFVKYFVRLETPEERQPPVQNAFDVLISTQRRLASQQYPNTIEHPWNRKDEFHNVIIDFFKQEKLCWTSSEVVHGVAGNTVRTLTDAMWFLDGHQATFRERSCDIPVVFDQFANFNCPEFSKHRKWSSSSLSSKCVCVYLVCVDGCMLWCHFIFHNNNTIPGWSCAFPLTAALPKSARWFLG